MTQNVHEPSAHEDWRDRSKQSLLYIPSVHTHWDFGNFFFANMIAVHT